jgi:GLPGLI family protein
MKKLFSYLLLATLVTIIFPVLVIAGDKNFEGIITYKISYPDSKFTESQMAMFPKLIIVSIKGSKSKSETNSTMGNQTEINDYADKSKITLLNMMGQKYAIRETAAEIQKDMEKEPKAQVEVTNETKTIAGYLSKKAIVTTNNDGEKTVYEVWFTEELGSKDVNFDNPIYKDINGVLMEFQIKTEQVTMKCTVSSVEKKSISSKEFEIPSDYTITTKEELKSKFGGM